ncbi:MAG: magnesium/cobalt transporter CorA [Anaerolineae bacterium]|nr:magnesium/cobalt transporter CorA [Anaerolineae bacterium]
MIRSLYYDADGALRMDLSMEAIAAARQSAAGLLWLDLCGEPPALCQPILRDMFGFHPLAVDDALAESHHPKVDDWGEYLLVVLHGVVFDRQAEPQVRTQELDIFLGRSYVITYRTEPIAAVERVWELCQRDVRHIQHGPDHLLYKLADEVVADYMPAVEAIDEAIDRIEDDLFDGTGIAVPGGIFRLKRGLLHLRRIIAPQREVLNKLSRGDFPVILDDDRVFFRDVYDHLVRLYDITESLRDLVASVLDSYLSVVNNRMNDVMKTLTVIATLFMPLSFVVGFFGMNFFQPVTSLDAWTDLPAFVLTLLILLAVPATMIVWMRHRHWM